MAAPRTHGLLLVLGCCAGLAHGAGTLPAGLVASPTGLPLDEIRALADLSQRCE